ncbi:MAG: DNA polymerase I [Pelatocladus maniniholoensis HA4357-MV3]|jgi:DNA polymerase-1|uniref:DNA polymerase I n=1 Tax=Pelatocladus maniniholoensis HA4357-MV3 TaxID=1117104 RepID=A0A9E3H8R5_9NOST|nr:DNA polymerase I [Pelatocladus maniniholoensis HA4357-MV3]
MSQTTPSNSITTRPTFILIDGHSLAFRSYFAFAKGRDGGLRTKTGTPTSVCFGFLKCLLEVMTVQQPQAIAVAFDLGLPTFRHEADDTYKADRPGTPEDFVPDLKNLHELLDGFNLKILTAPGYEADDVLGTIAQKATATGYQVKILTGDRDLFQLIDPEKEISVLYFSPDALKRSTSTNGISEFGPEEVKQKLGILPSQVIDYKALCGDKSDNIPGVKGIGEKTAVQLLNTYGSLEQIYASLSEIKGATQKKLELGKEDAEKSRFLAAIVLDVPLDINLEDCKLKGFDSNVLTPILENLEFKYFLGKINQLQKKFGGNVTETSVIETEDRDVELPYGNAKSERVSTDDEDLWFFSAAETEQVQQQQNTSIIQPRIIDTEAKLTELINLLKEFTDANLPIAWDTETNDLEPRDAELVGIGCCWGTNSDEIAYIPLNHQIGENLNKEIALQALSPIFESINYPKTFQNAKFDRLVFKCQGIKLAGVVFDPMLASYVLNPDSSHNLSDLTQKHLGLTIKNYLDVVPKGKTIADIEINKIADYCGLQVWATFQLVPKLRAELDKIPALHQLLMNVEQPLEAVLADMEYNGIHINTAYLNELSQQLETDLAKLEQQAYEIAGEKFNLGSPKQLSQILFEKSGLSTKYSRKIKTGYSTDAATLERLREVDTTGIIDAIIEYRTLAKLKSTYVDALPALVRADTKRVHTDFNQAATSTGRLSSSNPNLQNIPIRTAFSRQIRKAFLPESGWLMVAADYSQIELRILTHLSQEPVLVEAYQNNEDIHTVTARLMFEKEDITSDERRVAKTINFGVIYGMGSLRFSRSTGVDRNLANEFIKRFSKRYPKIFEYLEGLKKQAIAQGYVETILGRRRYFEFTTNSLRQLKGSNQKDIDLGKLKNLGNYDTGLLRSAANAPIQGSSADIIKIAMVRLHEILQNYQARLLLQVHDELVFEIPPQEWEELQIQIKSAMENAVQLSVPLVVDVRAGDNWMETK